MPTPRLGRKAIDEVRRCYEKHGMRGLKIYSTPEMSIADMKKTHKIHVPVEQRLTKPEHDYDIDWDVKTTLGTFTISRIDRQGLSEPARWTSVKVGDPETGRFKTVAGLEATPGNATSLGITV